MKHLIPYIGCLLFTLSTSGMAAEAKKPEGELKAFTADYKADVSGVPFSGTGSRSLKKDGDEWVLEFGADAALFGMEERTRFKIDKNLIQPQSYRHKRTGFGSKPAKTAQFDWTKMIASWQQDDEKSSVKLTAGAQDELSYQLQLRMDLKAGKTALSYPIIDDDKIYERSFIIEDQNEVLETPVGKLNTVRVKVNRESKKRETWIWFAKDWDYILVRLEQKEKDSRYLIEFNKGEVADQKIEGLKAKSPSK